MKRLSQLAELYRTNRDEFRRVFRYLLVGGWNTLFGMGVYALLFFCFGKHVNYLVLAIPANILAITNAYICYKLIVFKTRGNILREYLKCYLVYGFSALLGMGLLFLAVELGGLHPVVANVAITGLTVAVSYVGHRFFSFRQREV